MTTPYTSQSVPHDSAHLHVTGKAQYVDDIPTHRDTLHLAFGLSKIAKGKLQSIDLVDVKNAQGVVKVITASDIPGKNDVSPAHSNEPLLAQDQVEYIGQPIFLVVADNYTNARKAARLAKIVYEQELPVITIDQALKTESFFEKPLVYEVGEPDLVISKAPHNVEGQIELGGQEQFYLEGQIAMAIPQEQDGMMIYSSSQHPSEVQHKAADCLNTPINNIRVEVRRMGGAFGGKESQATPIACAAAIAAKLTGKPCKLKFDRDDDFVITGKRHDFRIKYRVGFDQSGKIQGIVFQHYIRCGWSLDLSLAVCDRAMLHIDNAYHLPHARVESYRLKTNTQSATAFRGFGGPQAIAGIERVIDHLAHHLRVDPCEIRQTNFYPSPLSRKLKKTHYGMIVKDCQLSEIFSELLSTSNYYERRKAIREWNQSSPILKKGIAISPVKYGISFTLSHLNQAGSLVHVYQDGSIHLNHGGTEMGQGLMVKIAQVAAHEFGQPLHSVRISPADTDKIPNTSATAASSGADINGMATKIACNKIVDRLKDFLALEHQIPTEQVTFIEGEFQVRNETYTFKEVIAKAYTNRISLSATGFYATPKLHWNRFKGQGRPFFYFAYGAAVSEVIIDTLTGENKIIRADILHDVGRSINPAIDLGQIEGGFVQGYGWLTTEELFWDNKGELKTHAPSTYKIPTCSDRPLDLRVKLWENGWNKEQTIYNSKAVGEPPLILGISVLLAISDAIAATKSSYPSLNAPATPERILTTILQS